MNRLIPFLLLLCFGCVAHEKTTRWSRELLEAYDSDEAMGVLYTFDQSLEAWEINKAWTNIFATVTNNIQVLFPPGEYSVTNELVIPSGSSNILVSGYGATLSWIDSNASGDKGLITTGGGGAFGRNITVEGFRLDLSGISGASAASYRGLTVEGDGHSFTDITVIEPYSYGGSEGFAVLGNWTNCVLTRVNVIGSGGDGYTCGICPVLGERNIFRDCSIDLQDYSFAKDSTGISAYSSDSIYSGIIITNATRGFYGDHSGVSNVVYKNITLSDSVISGKRPWEIYPLRNTAYSNIVTKGCVIDTSQYYVKAQEASYVTNLTQSMMFIGNQFTGTPTAGNNIIMIGVGHAFHNNTFSSTPAITGTQAETVYGSGNMVNGVRDDSWLPPQWNDVRIPILSTKVPATANPDFKAFRNGTYTYAFDSGTDEQVYCELQTPHGLNTNHTLRLHLHWSGADAPTGDATNVVWGAEMTYADPGGTFPATTTYYGTNGISQAYEHEITAIANIPAGALIESGVVIMRIFRDADNSDDDYGFDAHALSLDLHYPVLYPGSFNEYGDY